MQLKKIAIVFLVVVAIFSCAGAFALAQEGQPASLELSVKYSDSVTVGDKIVVKPGDSFDVSIRVDSNPGIILLSADLVYNPEILECTAYYLGNVFSKVEGEVSSVPPVIPGEGETPSGILKCFIAQTDKDKNNTNTGVFVTYSFTVKSSFDGNIEDLFIQDVVAATEGYKDFVEAVITKNAQTIHAHAFETPELLPGDCEKAESKKFTCSRCGEEVIATIGTPIGHDNKTLVERVPATCVTTGFEEHFRCAREDCGQYFAVAVDENGAKVAGDKVSYEDLVLPSDNGHLYTFVPEVSADCENSGKEAHYICERESCGQLAQKAEGSDEYVEVEENDIVIPAAGHDYKYVAYAAPLCEVAGKEAHYVCSNCPKFFIEVDGEKVETAEAQLLIAALEHDLGKIVERVDPTAASFGMKAHYLCQKGCGQYFDSEQKKTTYLELRIDKLPPEIKEADDSWVKGDSDAKVEFKSDGHIDDFKDFWFGNQKLEKDKDYTVREGSIIVTLTDSFLATLEPGKSYEVGIESVSGIAKTTFAVTHDYGTIVEYLAPTCMTNGNNPYYYCGPDCCNTYFDADKNIVAQNATEIPAALVIKALGHKPAGAKILAKDPTCTEIGYTVDCYKCKVCDGYYNMNATGEFYDLAADIVEIEALGHNGVTKVDAVAPTCVDKGNVEHYLCERCGATVNAENEAIDVVIAELGHNGVTKVDAVAPTCVDKGNIEHYLCERCGATVDASNEVIASVEVPAKGHNYGELIAKVESDCEKSGTIAHYKCSACQKTFDADKKEVTNLVIPAKGHSYGELIAKVEPTCEDTGVIAYYKCSVCQKTFDADKNEVTNLVIPANGHSYGELIAKVEPTCEDTGVIAYYKCSVCEKTFDADKNEVTDLVIPANGHSYGDLVAKVEPTTEAEGNVAYYQCSACSKYFDASKNEIVSPVIEKLPKMVSTPENPVWTKGDDTSLKFVSDADYDKFLGVKLNGSILEQGAYKLEKDDNGNTVVTIESAYLETLEKGEYTLSIESENGVCSASFTVENNNVAAVIIIVIAVVVLVAGVAAAVVVLKKKKII